MKLRFAWIVLFAALTALLAAGCNEEARLSVLFTGDEHDYITPAG